MHVANPNAQSPKEAAIRSKTQDLSPKSQNPTSLPMHPARRAVQPGPKRMLPVTAGADVFEDRFQVGGDERVFGVHPPAVHLDAHPLFEIDHLRREPYAHLRGPASNNNRVRFGDFAIDLHRHGARRRRPGTGIDHCFRRHTVHFDPPEIIIPLSS